MLLYMLLYTYITKVSITIIIIILFVCSKTYIILEINLQVVVTVENSFAFVVVNVELQLLYEQSLLCKIFNSLFVVDPKYNNDCKSVENDEALNISKCLKYNSGNISLMFK